MSHNNNDNVLVTTTNSDEMPDLQEISSDEDWTDDEDLIANSSGDLSQQVQCIFTAKLYPNAKDYFLFLKQQHGFDIWNLVHVDLNLDFFGYVKLINYMRTHFADAAPPTFKELIASKSTWDADEYFKPVICDDPLLQFMIDDEEEEDLELELFSDRGYLPKTSVNPQSSEESDNTETMKSLKEKLINSEEKNQKLESYLKEVTARMNEMKDFMKDVIMTGEIYRPVAACRMQHDGEEEDYEDSGYFGTYSHHDIHAEMLQDKVRTLSYQNAILLNSDAFHDKIVLDVGCGTGILSMFAVKAGAKHVYAVDMSDIAYQAMDIIRENKMDDKVTVIKGCIEEVQLPVSEVDIIVSEWMGYFLLYESMLDSVLYAAEKWLSPNGLVLPNGCSIILTAAHDEDLFKAQVQYWDDVYGFRMSCIKKASMNEASIQIIKPDSIVSESASVMDFTVPAITMKKLNYKSQFKLKITKNGKCSAIVGYFDIHFKDGLPTPVSFSTGPFSTPTHWKQTIFFLEQPISVVEGDTIHGSIDCRKNPHDPRSLLVELTVGGNKRMYTVS